MRIANVPISPRIEFSVVQVNAFNPTDYSSWDAVIELGRRNEQAAAAIKELTERLADDHVQVRRVTAQTIGIVLMEH